jgi:excinuclease ABC subunit A
MTTSGEWIRVHGARAHNLRSLNVDIPRNALTVVTGPSGSGKSSLAFDTLYAEGQRRFLETLHGDARALFQQLQRPDVDAVDGLPPTLCVSQHVVAPRPRSTLATVTEIHDHLRLLWARFGTPLCPDCLIPIRKHTIAEIVRETMKREEGCKIYVLATLVQDQPGDHQAVFQHIRQSGFLRARVDGDLREIHDISKLAARKPHTIELVVDRLVVRGSLEDRLRESLQTAAKHGDGRVGVTDIDSGEWRDALYSTRLACVRCRRSQPDLEPRRLHFNQVEGACPRCTGFGQVWAPDPKLIVPDRNATLAQIIARLKEALPESVELPELGKRELAALQKTFDPDGATWTLHTPLSSWPEAAQQVLLHGRDGLFPGLVPALQPLVDASGDDEDAGESLVGLAGYVVCPECGGARLNREARAVRFADRGLHEATALSVDDALAFFTQVAATYHARPETHRALFVLLEEITKRLGFLQQVGLGYLTLDRPAPTLSGGEAQRARLAAHLGGGLLGVCYLLDEPTMGLHPRDTDRLIAALRDLQHRGNTVVVVEHDEAVIRQADWLIDIGPGAGRDGGRLLASGPVAEVLRHPDSVTGKWLDSSLPSIDGTGPSAALPRRLTTAGLSDASMNASTPHLTIRGARQHNLKNLTVALPLGRWICLTGVSGSGKSTLARDILAYALRRHLGLLAPPPGDHDRIDGLEHIDKLIELDQKPLGRSSRSNAATYLGLFDEIRKVYASVKLSKTRGYKATRFSFNTRGGRCEECQGQGSQRVAVPLLPDLRVTCPHCLGKRFNPATLEVQYKGRSIADVLAMTVAEAVEFFRNVPMLHLGLQALDDVGLGYVQLGQPASTLSGGEAQRVKLAAELSRKSTGRTLYLFDEPTSGLHVADIARLLRVFRRLVEAGNTLLVIEHHLDVIAAADWVIDLGPEAGAAGGHLVAEGPPAAIAACDASLTGRFLRKKAGGS